jgi:hypothetical protein
MGASSIHADGFDTNYFTSEVSSVDVCEAPLCGQPIRKVTLDPRKFEPSGKYLSSLSNLRGDIQDPFSCIKTEREVAALKQLQKYRSPSEYLKLK